MTEKDWESFFVFVWGGVLGGGCLEIAQFLADNRVLIMCFINVTTCQSLRPLDDRRKQFFVPKKYFGLESVK